MTTLSENAPTNGSGAFPSVSSTEIDGWMRVAVRGRAFEARSTRVFEAYLAPLPTGGFYLKSKRRKL